MSRQTSYLKDICYMKSSIICIMILLMPLISSGKAVRIEGMIKQYGWDAQKNKQYIILIADDSNPKYYFSSDLLFIVNHTKASMSQDKMMAEASIYSFRHYPRRAKLRLNENHEIVRVDVIFIVLKGYIQNFDPDKNIIKIQKNMTHKTMLQKNLGEHVALPDMNQWSWNNLAGKTDIDLLVDSDTTLRYNFEIIDTNEIQQYIGKEIHVVLDDNRKPCAFNIYDFDQEVYFSRPACSGYVIQWENDFSEVSIWEPHDMDKMLNDFYSHKTISDLIQQNKMKKEFDLKANYKFAKDASLYVKGKRQEAINSGYYSFRNWLEVNSCFFYGPTYLKYDDRGKVKTIIVPYEELE